MKTDYFSALVQVDLKTRNIIRVVCVFEDSHKAYEELKKLRPPFMIYKGDVYEVRSVEVELK